MNVIIGQNLVNGCRGVEKKYPKDIIFKVLLNCKQLVFSQVTYYLLKMTTKVL